MSPAAVQTLFRLLTALLFTFALGGCGDPSATPIEGSDEGAAAEIRLVSLSPALTRIAVDMGLKEAIVGRTQFCSAVDSSIPVVGDHFTQDLEILVRLRPTHLLIQPPRNEVPQQLRELAEQNGWAILSWRIDTIEDVLAIVRELPARLAPDDSALRGELEERAREVLEEIEAALTPDLSSSERGVRGEGAPDHRAARDDTMRILLIYSTDPVISVFGADTYLDEIIRAFGGENAAAHISGWGQMSLEDVVRLDADAIVVVSQREIDGGEALGPLAKLELRAIASKRVAVLTHAEALLPSTSIIEVAQELRAILKSFEEERP